MNVDIPDGIVIGFGHGHVMDLFTSAGSGTSQTAREYGRRAPVLLVLTAGSQGLVVRVHRVIKGRGWGGTSGRKGATYGKSAIYIRHFVAANRYLNLPPFFFISYQAIIF